MHRCRDLWPEGRRLIHEKMSKFKKAKKALPPGSPWPNPLIHYWGTSKNGSFAGSFKKKNRFFCSLFLKKEPPKESVGQKSGPPKMEQNLEVLFKSSLVGRRIRTQIQNILTVTFLDITILYIFTNLNNLRIRRWKLIIAHYCYT